MGEHWQPEALTKVRAIQLQDKYKYWTMRLKGASLLTKFIHIRCDNLRSKVQRLHQVVERFIQVLAC
jgi:hypothetical protein